VTRPALLVYLAILYLAFVIYGSLVPLQIVPLPLGEAWRRFQEIPYLAIGMQGRADWVANLLLMIPLSFLWLAALDPGSGPLRRAALSITVWLGCIALALSIEFAQIFFPQRTVSINDLLAEGIGATAGVLLWWCVGARTVEWFDRWQTAHGTPSIIQQILWAYLGILVLYNVMPLDLAPSLGDLYQKWKSGRIVLVPFGFHMANPMEWLYEVASGIALWAPVTGLWILSGRRTAAQAWITTVAVAAAIEGVQVLVYTRVCDVTDVLIAGAGAAVGAWAGVRLARGRAGDRVPGGGTGRARWVAASVAGFLLWLAVLTFVFWYPFHVRADRPWVESRLALLREVPFFNYYYTSEYLALTQALRRIAFFIPLGAALGIGGAALALGRLRWVIHAMAVSVMIMVAAGIELGQVFLPGKYPDSTDLALEAIGGVAGYVGCIAVLARWRVSRGSR